MATGKMRNSILPKLPVFSLDFPKALENGDVLFTDVTQQFVWIMLDPLVPIIQGDPLAQQIQEIHVLDVHKCFEHAARVVC